MDESFWQRRWERNEIAFHEPRANPVLVDNIAALGLMKGARILLPLSGKTLDMPWLASQGFRVVGSEFNPLAVNQFFAELGVTPAITPAGSLQHYTAGNIEVLLGDFFAAGHDDIGPVDAVFDRGALVALPPEVRARYANHVIALTRQAPQLLVCYEYDQALMPGPPFSVDAEEVAMHYGETYDIRQLSSAPVSGGLKSHPATQVAWLLT